MFILNYLGYYGTKIIHFGITSFIVMGPFIIKTPDYLVIHSLFSSLILSHWKNNDDHCVLTLLEEKFRKLLNKTSKKEECFTYKLIAPIYNFNQNYEKYNLFSYVALGSLLCISYGKFLFLNKNKIIEFYKNIIVNSSLFFNIIPRVLFLL
jgi:hypothetical protein